MAAYPTVQCGRVQPGGPLVVPGYPGSSTIVAALLLTATLKAAEIAPPSPASPWSIDPNRSQEMKPNF